MNDRTSSNTSATVDDSNEYPTQPTATSESGLIETVNSRLSEQYRIEDIALIMIGVLSMSYGSLVLFNTGTFAVDVTSTVTTFAYTPPVAAMVTCLILYGIGIFCLLNVGADWSPRLTSLSWILSGIYAAVGVIFHDTVFDSPRVRENAQGGKTDAYVLQREGAARFLEGKNPYQYDYADEILSEVPAYFRTPLSPTFGPQDLTEPINIVTSLDYPPISFLWYVPSEMLGIPGPIQDITAVGLIMIFLLLVTPKSLRLVVPIFFMLNWNMILFPASFVPDMAWVFFVVAAVFTAHYPKTNAVLWAFAASYRPQPILVASFFAIFVYKEFGFGYLKSWVSTGLVCTALINVPFAIWTGPSAYWAYITIPVRITIPPGGIGPAMIFSTDLVSETAATSGIHSLFSYAVLGVWVLSLVGLFVYYDRIGVGGLAFPGLALWFHWRSFENYLIWMPLIVFAAYMTGFPHRDPIHLLSLRVQAAHTAVRERLRRLWSRKNSVQVSTKNQK